MPRKQGRYAIDGLLYGVYRVTIALDAIRQHYRARFGIETRYRIKNQDGIRTLTLPPFQ